MKNLFKNISEENRKTKVIHVRVTLADAETITASAAARNLNVCDFVRRAALGRRADVRFETEIVLKLIDVVKAIRILHGAMVAEGIPSDEPAWGLVIDEALCAMRRISK